ncbi:MAG: hypothetical protein ACLUSV_05590 [Streptococcus sp.]
MNGILEDNSARANAIIIPDKTTYEKALTLVPKENTINYFSYAYDFRKIMANHTMPLSQPTQINRTPEA